MNFKELKNTYFDFDFYDGWSSALNLMFNFCEFLYLEGYEVPHELEYTPSVYLTEAEDPLFYEFCKDLEVELIYTSLKILDRYTRLLKHQERDY